MTSDTPLLHEVGDALLDVGASLPLITLRLPLLPWRWVWRVRLSRPRLGGLILLSQRFMRLGFTLEEIEAFTASERMAFFATRGRLLSEMLALTILKSRLSTSLLLRPLAWLIRHRVETQELAQLALLYSQMLDLRPFAPIIRSAAHHSPMLSQAPTKRGS